MARDAIRSAHGRRRCTRRCSRASGVSGLLACMLLFAACAQTVSAPDARVDTPLVERADTAMLADRVAPHDGCSNALPRLVAPISTATAQRPRPEFRVERADTGADWMLQVCRDRQCNDVVVETVSSRDVAISSSELPNTIY